MGAIKTYTEAKQRVADFLRNFYQSDGDGIKTYVYSDQTLQIAQRKQIALHVALDDVQLHDPDLKTEIEGNTRRYQKIFAEAIDEYIKELMGSEEVGIFRLADDIRSVSAPGTGRAGRLHLPAPLPGEEGGRAEPGAANAGRPQEPLPCRADAQIVSGTVRG